MKWLIDNGAKPNSKDKMAKTALHFASENDYPQVVKLLKENGSNTNIKDKDENTPLHYALINKGSLETVKYLIQNLVIHNEIRNFGSQAVNCSCKLLE